MRTIIYVDGFNLYYGALKNTSYKWLNLKALFSSLLTANDIIAIKYFTARISSTASDPHKANHQDAYIRALIHSIPELEVHFGQFTTHNVKAKLVKPIGKVKYAEIIRTSEKGSDVNLAVNLVNDAWLDKYDCAIMVSNDSDLAESIRLVKKHHRRKKIGLITIRNRVASKELISEVDFIRHISATSLAASQFPDAISGTKITKPPDW